MLVVALSFVFYGGTFGDELLKCSISKKEDKVKTVYVLENGFLQVTINPANGGGLESLAHKPTGTKLSIPLGESGGEPSFMDRVYCQYSKNEKTIVDVEYFVKYPYTAEILKDSSDEASLKVSCRSRSERMGPWLTVSKIYTLKRNESALSIQHVLENDSDSPGKAGVWIVTFLRAAGEMFSERNNFFSPTTNGVVKITHPGKDASMQGDWVMNPALNWKAIIGDSTGIGIVAVLDYSYLSCFYDWYTTTGFISTLEWAIREQEIKGKDKFATKCVLMPVTEFARVDGVIGGKIACGISLPEKKLKAGEEIEAKITLISVADAGSEMIVRLAAPDGAKELVKKEINLKAGTTFIEKQLFKSERDGAYKLEIELSENGKTTGKVARPFTVGEGLADKKTAPLDMPKVGNDFLFPVIHLNLPGKEKLEFTTAALAAGAEIEDKAEKAEPALDMIEVLTQNTDITHEAQVNFTKLMKEKKIAGVFDENSVRVTETDKEGTKIRNVSCNFIKHNDYNNENFTAGKVLFQVDKSESEKRENGEEPFYRYYRIWFDVEGKEKTKNGYDTGLQQANLINYGGFEETEKSLYSKEGWGIGKWVEITEEAAHSGKRSLKLRALPDEETCVTFSPFCQVRPKERYNISLWEKANSARGGLYVCNCKFFDQKGQYLDNSKTTVTYNKDPFFAWTKTEKVIEAPEGASSLRLDIVTRATEGEVYVDDVSVTPVPKAGLSLKDDKHQTEKMYPCLDYYFDISDKYETPHVKWMKPSAGGKIKTLYANYMRYVTDTTKRQAIEFAQRMDLNYKFIPLLKRMKTHSSGTLGMSKGDTYTDDLEQYIVGVLGEEIVKDYQVVVVQGLDFKGVQKKVVEMLLNEVKKGKGLVLLDCENLPLELERILTEGKTELPPYFYCIPEIRDDVKVEKQMSKICRLAALGKGRIALINMGTEKKNYPCVPPPCLREIYPNYYGREIPYWEYMMLPAIKAIVWASSGKGAVTVDKFAYKDGVLTAEINSSNAQEAVLEITYRDEYNQTDTVTKKPVKLVEGKNESKVELPKMRKGFHLADYRLMNNKDKIFDFGSYCFTTPLTAEIKEITFDREYYRSGEEIKVRIALTNIPADCRLVCEIEDTYNRKIKTNEVGLKEDQPEALISFNIENPLAILHRLFARVMKNDDVVVRKMAEFSMPFNYPPDDELMAYAWYGQTRGLKLWGDNGFDSVIFSVKGEGNILKTLCNMNIRPFGHGIGNILGKLGDSYKGGGGNDLIRDPCFSDPERWSKIKKKCVEIMTKNKHVFYGVRDYQLCDELYLGAKVCFSPYCLADFRTYLKEKHQSLEELNRVWQSNFKTWDEVQPIQISEVNEEKENLPQWLDHRMFMNLVFARWVARHKEIVREINPNAKIGLSGTDNPCITYNWWELMKYMDCLGNYGGIQTDLINSFKLPGARTGAWIGGYVATQQDYERGERYFPWAGVFNGSTAYMFFHGSAYGTTLLGDLRFNRNGQYAVEEIKELKSGIAKMLFSSERLIDGIGMHYSQSSMFAAMATIGKEYWGGALDSWKYLINDLGLNFDFISYEQLEKGEIDNAKYKLFILPVSLSLSSGETAALKKYVGKGGILLTDYGPGIYDEHGRKNANEELMKLFGVRRNKDNRVGIRECRMKIKANEANNLKEQELPTKYGEEGLELTTGKAYGDSGNSAAPAVIINQFGKGKAILLNCVFNDYAKVTLGGTGGETSELDRGNPSITTPTREFLNGIIEGCGIKRSVVIKTKDSADFQLLTQTIRYTDGPGQYVGILKQAGNYNEPVKPGDYVPVEIIFGLEGHMYDVRGGKYLGKGRTVKAEIAPAVARLYAILPYEVKKVEMESVMARRAGETIKIPVKIKASDGTPGNHVIHIEVHGPDRKIRNYYSTNVKLKKGSGEIEINTALNDEKGKWEITAKDTATGIKGKCELELK